MRQSRPGCGRRWWRRLRRMRSRGWMLVALVGASLWGRGAGCGRGEGNARAERTAARCRRAVFEGEVRAGQGFRKSFGGGLDLLLDPTAGGWVLRVLPTSGRRPAEDYAEISTPPYRSVSPLLVSTDFGFRAQDAVGWNPRRFRYAQDAGAFGTLEGIYRGLAGRASPEEEARLAELASRQPEGVFEILDANLSPGTGDQTRAAGLVASHFGTTAHRIEPAEGGRATALGRIFWIRFRVRLELRPGVRVLPGINTELHPCEG